MRDNWLSKIRKYVVGQQPTIFEFNIVGLDNSVQKDENFMKLKEKIVRDIHSLNENLNKEIDQLYDAFDEIDENEFRERKARAADQIIDKLMELSKMGKENRLYKLDYALLKRELLLTLIKLFETQKDMKLLERCIGILETNEIIPHNSEIEIMKLTPMGRWL